MPKRAKAGERKTPNSRVTVEYGEDLYRDLDQVREEMGFVSTSEFLRWIAREWLRANA